MAVDEALLEAARPPVPEGLELDERGLIVQDIIARTRLEAYEIVGKGPDRPYFHPDATLPMTQRYPLVPAVANIAAFALGMTDPKNANPTIVSMRRKGRVVGRNADTAAAFKTVLTGPQKEADPVINRVFVMHAWLHAQAMAQAEGPHPERAAEDPFDPDRGIWTVDCLEWATEEVFEGIVRPFSGLERPILRKIDYPLFGGFFGSEAPKDPGKLVRERIERGELRLTDAAKEVAMRNWHYLPVPRWLLPARKHVIQVVEGILPEEVRKMYGLPDLAEQEEDFQKAVTKLARLNRMLMLVKKDGDSWLFELAAREEERLQARGLLPEIPDPYALAA